MTDSQLLLTPSTVRPWAKRQIVKFGNMTIPGIGGTQPWIDLNDEVSWFVDDYQPSGDHINILREQQTWNRQGSWTGTDFTGRTITIPVLFDESGGVPLSRYIAQMAMAGEQWLTFDNIFGARCKFSGYQDPKIETPGPYLRSLKLSFMTRDPWIEDMAGATVTSTLGPFNSDTGGATPHNIVVNYDGTVVTKPILYLTIGGQIAAASWGNANEGTTVSWGVSSSGGASQIVVDSNTFQINSNYPQAMPPSGTFPMLYPGTNTFVIYVKNPTTVSCTAYIGYVRRFEMP